MVRKNGLRQKKKANPRSKTSNNVGRFVCPICQRGFTRRETVKDPHFPSCVRKHGNPKGLRWDEDPSCWMAGVDGPSVKRVIKQRRASNCEGAGGGDDKEKIMRGEGDDETEENEKMTSSVRNHAYRHDYDDLPYLPSTISEASTVVPDDFLDPSLLTSDTTVCNESAQLIGNTAPYLFDVTGYVPSTPTSPHRHPAWLQSGSRRHNDNNYMSLKTMSQMANVAFLATRERARISDEEAMQMWDIWNGLLPEGTTSNISRPKPGWQVTDRQQAVVWIAQDSYTEMLKETTTPMQQLQIVTLWRQITEHVGNMEGVVKINVLVTGELGPTGLLWLS